MQRLWEENERLKAAELAIARANSQLRLELGLLQAAENINGNEEVEDRNGDQGAGINDLLRGQPETDIEKIVSQHQVGRDLLPISLAFLA